MPCLLSSRAIFIVDERKKNCNTSYKRAFLKSYSKMLMNINFHSFKGEEEKCKVKDFILQTKLSAHIDLYVTRGIFAYQLTRHTHTHDMSECIISKLSCS